MLLLCLESCTFGISRSFQCVFVSAQKVYPILKLKWIYVIIYGLKKENSQNKLSTVKLFYFLIFFNFNLIMSINS